MNSVQDDIQYDVTLHLGDADRPSIRGTLVWSPDNPRTVRIDTPIRSWLVWRALVLRGLTDDVTAGPDSDVQLSPIGDFILLGLRNSNRTGHGWLNVRVSREQVRAFVTATIRACPIGAEPPVDVDLLISELLEGA